jgi:FlaA1/EpsC-like NDP-sugar epimerase
MKNKLSHWILQGYQSLSRRKKRWLLIVLDIVICLTAIVGAFYLRNLALTYQNVFSYTWQVFLLISIKLWIFRQRGMYRPILRYTGIEFVSNAALSVFISSALLVFLAYLKGDWALPRLVVVIDGLLTLVLIVGARIFIPCAHD